MEFKQAKKYAKRALIAGFSVYAFCYLAMHDQAKHDYKVKNKARIEAGNVQNNLLVENYIATIGDKQKCLTIYGECHYYNKQENETALKLLEKYKEVYFEVGSKVQMRANMSKKNDILSDIINAPDFAETYYYELATGRSYPKLADIAQEKGIPVYPLEDVNGMYDNSTTSYKINTFLRNIKMALFAPWYYENMKYEFSIEQELRFQIPKDIYENLIVNRDPIMARSITEALKYGPSGPERPILVGFGLLHYNGVINILRNTEGVKLRWVNSLEECKNKLQSCEIKTDDFSNE